MRTLRLVYRLISRAFNVHCTQYIGQLKPLIRAVLAQNRGISALQSQEKCYNVMSLMNILFLLT